MRKPRVENSPSGSHGLVRTSTFLLVEAGRWRTPYGLSSAPGPIVARSSFCVAGAIAATSTALIAVAGQLAPPHLGRPDGDISKAQKVVWTTGMPSVAIASVEEA